MGDSLSHLDDLLPEPIDTVRVTVIPIVAMKMNMPTKL